MTNQKLVFPLQAMYGLAISFCLQNDDVNRLICIIASNVTNNS